MSDIMLYGVLRMPYELAMSDEISRLQFYQRAQEAADRLEKCETIPNTTPSQAASIDTPEFDDLLLTYWECRNQGESYAANERAELIAYIDAKLAQAREEGRQAGLKHACQTIENSNNTALEALRQRDDLTAQLARDKADWCNIPLQRDHPQELVAFNKWHTRVAPGFRQYSIYNNVELRSAWAAWIARATAAESRLAEIQRGVEGLTRYTPGLRWGVTGFEGGLSLVSRNEVLALLQPQDQADTSGLPG